MSQKDTKTQQQSGKKDEPRKISMFPKKIGNIVEKIARPTLRTKGLAGSKIITHWKEIVGVQLAQHSIPQQLYFPTGTTTGGTLTIAVENGFATELQHNETIILERISVYFGYKAINKIKISHSYTPPKKTPITKPQATLNKDCIKIAETVKDDELRKAFLSIASQLSK